MTINWRDKYGAVHNVPNPVPLSSENPALFYGTNVVLECELDLMTEEKGGWFVDYIEALHSKGYWMATPDSDRSDFSKDNWIGAAAGMRAIINWADRHNVFLLSIYTSVMMKDIKLFHKQLIHPVAWCTVFMLKYDKPWFNWVIKLGNWFSCNRDHKKDGLEVETSGKMLTLITWIAAGWGLPFENNIYYKIRPDPVPKIFKPLTGEWRWTSWYNIALEYYLQQTDHPNVERVKDWEGSL